MSVEHRPLAIWNEKRGFGKLRDEPADNPTSEAVHAKAIFPRQGSETLRILDNTPSKGLVLRRRFDVIDDHHLNRSFCGNELQPNLLLDRGVKAGRSVGIVTRMRRIIGSVAL